MRDRPVVRLRPLLFFVRMPRRSLRACPGLISVFTLARDEEWRVGRYLPGRITEARMPRRWRFCASLARLIL